VKGGKRADLVLVTIVVVECKPLSRHLGRNETNFSMIVDVVMMMMMMMKIMMKLRSRLCAARVREEDEARGLSSLL
jgi:hypothetical protein